MKREYTKIENGKSSFATHKLEKLKVRKSKDKPQTGRKYLQHL